MPRAPATVVTKTATGQPCRNPGKFCSVCTRQGSRALGIRIDKGLCRDCRGNSAGAPEPKAARPARAAAAVEEGETGDVRGLMPLEEARRRVSEAAAAAAVPRSRLGDGSAAPCALCGKPGVHRLGHKLATCDECEAEDLAARAAEGAAAGPGDPALRQVLVKLRAVLVAGAELIKALEGLA
jgi:hypothetical protein